MAVVTNNASSPSSTAWFYIIFWIACSCTMVNIFISFLFLFFIYFLTYFHFLYLFLSFILFLSLILFEKIIFNKAVMSSFNFPFPMFLTLWHMSLATIMTQILSRTTSLLPSVAEVKI